MKTKLQKWGAALLACAVLVGSAGRSVALTVPPPGYQITIPEVAVVIAENSKGALFSAASLWAAATTALLSTLNGPSCYVTDINTWTTTEDYSHPWYGRTITWQTYMYPAFYMTRRTQNGVMDPVSYAPFQVPLGNRVDNALSWGDPTFLMHYSYIEDTSFWTMNGCSGLRNLPIVVRFEGYETEPRLDQNWNPVPRPWVHEKFVYLGPGQLVTWWPNWWGNSHITVPYVHQGFGF